MKYKANIGYVDSKEKRKHGITVNSLGGNFVHGNIGKNYSYQAQVFQKPSKYGIYNGRISRLLIKEIQTGNILYSYERGCDKSTKKGLKLRGYMLKVFPNIRGK